MILTIMLNKAKSEIGKINKFEKWTSIFPIPYIQFQTWIYHAAHVASGPSSRIKMKNNVVEP